MNMNFTDDRHDSVFQCFQCFPTVFLFTDLFVCWARCRCFLSLFVFSFPFSPSRFPPVLEHGFFSF